jgi:hydroxypyruvate reductase
LPQLESKSMNTRRSIKSDAIAIWRAGVAAVHGAKLVQQSLSVEGDRFIVNSAEETVECRLDDFDRILVVGGGKFSHLMAEGLEQVLGSERSSKKRLSGIVTVPDGAENRGQLRFVDAVPCRPAGENFPTPRVLAATQRMIQELNASDERTLVISLISGGGSALLESSPLALEDIVAATRWLSSRGADILQLNTVRIAMSDVKGGGLARAMKAGRMISLIVSDVPGDDIRFVSSGPTVNHECDAVAKAIAVLEKFDAKDDAEFPAKVWHFLLARKNERDVSDSTNESAVKSDAMNAGVRDANSSKQEIQNLCIGNADTAVRAAYRAAQELGYKVVDSESFCDTETACEFGLSAANACRLAVDGPQAMISIGEPTVELCADAGRGGRNQHAILVAIDSLLAEGLMQEGSSAGLPSRAANFCLLSGGTDGEDGNTTAAGGVFQRSDLESIGDFQADAQSALRRCDSHRFLAKFGLVFESGATGTNVCDLRILLRC